ncbi:hypothetical protein LUZ60_001972 [Juncus effusus]|nr:hypothetical protein LUZ60_001972 [Juncus effusus]
MKNQRDKVLPTLLRASISTVLPDRTGEIRAHPDLSISIDQSQTQLLCQNKLISSPMSSLSFFHIWRFDLASVVSSSVGIRVREVELELGFWSLRCWEELVLNRILEELWIWRFILAKKGPLGTIWIAAHLERKLRKNQVADTDIGVSVDSILFPDVPIALRLSSHLLLGVVRIYSRKVNYLFHDCSEALLKIKQAFRSSNVDLPPEESTAPYHSITLPETFHLDDFELPDSAFQGDYDHHVSTKEQITLQDNLDKTGFSTSKFGLDERFGDGNASHVGLDLDEELFLHKNESTSHHTSIHFITNDDGNFEQGESSEQPTANMEIDDQNNKNPSNTDENYNSAPNWGSYNIPTPGYNVLTPAYNIQTPDLNEIFFTNNNNDNNVDGQSVPATPFAVDPDPPSPEITECAPPSTPGLMEETGIARANDASPSINYEDGGKIDNGNGGNNNGGLVLKPCLVNEKEGEKENVESGVKEGRDLNNEVADMQIDENVSDVNVKGSDVRIEENVADVVNLKGDDMQIEENNLKDNDMQVEQNNCDAVNLVDNSMQIEQLAEGNNNKDNNNNINNSDVINSKDANESTPQVLENTPESEQTPKEPPTLHANFTSTNQFTEPETMLHASNITNELGQTTAEKVILESDGSVGRTTAGDMIGHKRRLEEEENNYLMSFEKGSTERVSSRQRVRKSNSDFVNPDDDFLTSILGGNRTPGLRLGPTQSKGSSLKRQKVGPTPKTVKRKVQMDDSMVLHADVIRQQLISTEDIRRLRKKAPCTRAEIWIIEKGPLEDEIYNESLFIGSTEELVDLQHQVYEIDISKPLKQLLRETKGKETEKESDKSTNEAQIDIQNPIPNEAETLDEQNPKQNEAETLDDQNPKPNEAENLDDQNPATNEVENLDAQNPKSNEVVETLGAQNPNEEEILNVQTPFAVPYEGPFEFNNENCITDQQFENNNDNINNELAQNSDGIIVDLSKNEENLPEGFINVDEMKDELDNNNDNIMRNLEIDNLFEEAKENPNLENVNDESVQLQAENIQEGFLFNADGNATSAVGENSGYVDLESMGNDFAPKDSNDFGSVIEGVDTDFLNVDDEADYHEEENDDVANPGDLQSLDNSGWSSRTRGVARYLRVLFDEENGHGRKSVAIDQLLGGKTRKEASRMFFETLVLSTKDYIQVRQETPFGFVNVRPGLKLMESEF